jgi:hypothetical protein
MWLFQVKEDKTAEHAAGTEQIRCALGFQNKIVSEQDT